jgi:hypothetical protein
LAERTSAGREEGVKDRPCAVLLAITNVEGEPKIVVLPITHSPPTDPAHAVEIPHATKRRLGLDDERSWIVLTESNRFTWPGPDLRPSRVCDPRSVAYGLLPRALYEQVRDKWFALFKEEKTRSVARTV